MSIKWSKDWELGIPVVDSQHQRIVQYINKIGDKNIARDKQAIEDIMAELKDYTRSHFAFEETLMEEAGYGFVKAHARVHELFIRKIDDYWQEHKNGKDISDDLMKTLESWLYNHIMHDDQDYSDIVRANMTAATEKAKARDKSKSWFRKLFG